MKKNKLNGENNGQDPWELIHSNKPIPETAQMKRIFKLCEEIEHIILLYGESIKFKNCLTDSFNIKNYAYIDEHSKLQNPCLKIILTENILNTKSIDILINSILFTSETGIDSQRIKRILKNLGTKFIIIENADYLFNNELINSYKEISEADIQNIISIQVNNLNYFLNLYFDYGVKPIFVGYNHTKNFLSRCTFVNGEKVAQKLTFKIINCKPKTNKADYLKFFKKLATDDSYSVSAHDISEIKDFCIENKLYLYEIIETFDRYLQNISSVPSEPINKDVFITIYNTNVLPSRYQKTFSSYNILQEEKNKETDPICEFCGVLDKCKDSNYCNACKHENLS